MEKFSFSYFVMIFNFNGSAFTSRDFSAKIPLPTSAATHTFPFCDFDFFNVHHTIY